MKSFLKKENSLGFTTLNVAILITVRIVISVQVQEGKQSVRFNTLFPLLNLNSWNTE